MIRRNGVILIKKEKTAYVKANDLFDKIVCGGIVLNDIFYPSTNPMYESMLFRDTSHVIENIRINEYGDLIGDVLFLDTELGIEVQKWINEEKEIKFTVRGFADIRTGVFEKIIAINVSLVV